MNHLLAVISPEPDYAVRLARCLSLDRRFSFSAAAFYSAEDFFGFRHKNRICLILCDLRLSSDPRLTAQSLLRECPEAKTAYLCNDEETDSDAASPRISRFLGADEIISRLMRFFPEALLWKTACLNEQRNRIIGIYSPLGRCGKTALALTLTRSLASSKRALFIDLSEFPAEYCPDPSRPTLSDAVFLLRQGGLTAAQLQTLVCRTGGICCLPPVRNADDLTAAGPDAYPSLFLEILSLGLYDTIVADLGSLSASANSLLELCSIIYMPVLEDPLSKAKLERFDNYLSLTGRAELREKIQPLHVPEVRLSFSAGAGAGIEQLMFTPVRDLVESLHEDLK